MKAPRGDQSGSLPAKDGETETREEEKRVKGGAGIGEKQGRSHLQGERDERNSGKKSAIHIFCHKNHLCHLLICSHGFNIASIQGR